MEFSCLRWSHVNLFNKIIVSFVLLLTYEEEPHFLELKLIELKIESELDTPFSY
jgi:hypothetical protein